MQLCPQFGLVIGNFWNIADVFEMKSIKLYNVQ